MVALALLAAVLAALVVLYMSRPRFVRLRLSAARFLTGLPAPRKAGRRLALSAPLTSPPFYLQAGVVLLLVVAVVLDMNDVSTRQSQGRIGVWLMVDTSYSMSTHQAGTSRMALAGETALSVLRHVSATAGRGDACVRISAFDLERRDLYAGPIDRANAAIDGLAPRPFGTDLSLARPEGPMPDDGCPPTHLVVISDRPALEPGTLPLVWLDIAEPVSNVAVEAIEPVRDPLDGQVRTVGVVVAATGERPQAQLTLTGPDGSVVARTPVEWPDTGPWTFRFQPGVPGSYAATVEPGGAYDGDDVAVFAVKDAGPVRIDWRVAGTERPTLAAPWEAGGGTPTLRIAYDLDAGDGVPTLMIGPGLRPGTPSPVDLFLDRHPILDGVNLDLLDQAGMSPATLPAGFEPVAAHRDGSVWVAVRDEPRAVYLPALATGGSDGPDRAAVLLTANALRWLLGERDAPAAPPDWLAVDGTPIAGAQGEAPLPDPPRSTGALDDLRPGGAQQRVALWPWAVLLAALLLAVERAHGAFGREA